MKISFFRIKKKLFFPFVMIFFIISNITFNFKINTLHFSFLISLLYIFMKNFKLNFSKIFFKLLLLAYGVCFFALIGASLTGFIEYNIISMPTRLFIYAISVMVIYDSLSYSQLNRNEIILFFLKVVVITFLLNSFVVYIEFFSPKIRDFIYSIVDVGKVARPPFYGYRYTGLMQSLPVVSFNSSIAALIAFYLSINKKKIRYLLFSLIIASSLFLVGRSGLVIYLLGALIMVLSVGVKKAWFILVPIIFIVIIFIININSFFQLAKTYRSIGRTIEFYNIDSGTFNFKTDSTDDLFNKHYIPLPHKSINLFFGYGTTVTNMVDTILVNSDVGFIKIIYFSGFLGLSFVLLFHFFCLRCSLFLFQDNKLFKKLLIILFFSFLAFNMKDYVIFGGPYFVLTLFFIINPKGLKR